MKTSANLSVLLLTLVSLIQGSPAQAQSWSGSIRINQIGYYPGATKAAIVEGDAGDTFLVTTPDLADTVFAGSLGPERPAEFSGTKARLADFSELATPGTYVLVVPGTGYSHQFEVRPRVHEPLSRAVLKAFYHQRASTRQPVAYAGAWSRPAGHPDDRVLVHPSAASAERPTGTVLSSPGGWYDAGDYNKYIVNSGISVATLLSLYEDFPGYLASQDAGIPESGNALPDVLDEALWNLRWMMTMQDPHDGGVYHKLTTAKFAGQVMPVEGREQRYVVQKSTSAALDFAAVMAQASRIFRRFDHAVPGLADSTLTAAHRAWRWARQRPEIVYDQNRLNESFDPDIVTGAYGDSELEDEFIWAAAELYITTRQDSFYTAVSMLPDSAAPVPTWRSVRTLGYYSLLRHRERLTLLSEPEVSALERILVSQADSMVAEAERRAYRTPMGGEKDFVWGSNSVAANQGIALIEAYRITRNSEYLRHALANLDYLLGRNATGYSYVTGFGDHSPHDPHHRPSAADGVGSPVPGWLVGGPNPGRQDQCEYPSTLADQAYVDDWCSYASNEVAINWNAPFVYLVAALEALQYEIGHHSKSLHGPT